MYVNLHNTCHWTMKRENKHLYLDRVDIKNKDGRLSCAKLTRYFTKILTLKVLTHHRSAKSILRNVQLQQWLIIILQLKCWLISDFRS